MSTLPGHVSELDDETRERLKACMKKPIPINALQMDCEFRVDSMEGDYAQGKVGDYLMCGVQGELYICDKQVFELTYDWLRDD